MALSQPRLAIATPRSREGLAEVIARQGRNPDAVLAEMGLSAEEIAGLRARQVV